MGHGIKRVLCVWLWLDAAICKAIIKSAANVILFATKNHMNSINIEWDENWNMLINSDDFKIPIALEIVFIDENAFR